jgi:Subtilase family
MASRFLAIGALGILTAITAVSAVGPSQPMLHRPNLPGPAQLHIAGSRSLQQRESATASKFDGSLAELSRHANSVRPGHALEDLHALNPAERFSQPADSSTPLVLIDAITKGDPQKLKAALVGLGLQRASQYSNDVGGWLPVNQLEAATSLGELHAIRAAMMRTKSGAVTSQGDYAQNSDLVRSQNALTGAGITVGIISDSYDCYQQYKNSGQPPPGGDQGYANNGFTATAATDISTADIPASVNVIEEATCQTYGAPIQLPFGDEGRAMMQVVRDVAPGAGLAFYTAENSEADFASGIAKLAAPVASGGAGAKIIVDDVGYFDEPFFQDGLIAQAVNSVVASGVAYFSSAGNNGTLAYNNNSPNFASLSSTAPNAGEHLLNFDQSGSATATTSLPVTIPSMIPGEFVTIVVEWDQPYVTGAPSSGGSTSSIDVCITGATGNDVIANGNLTAATCSGASGLGQDPVQIMIIDNPANSGHNSSIETLNIQVGLVSGTTPGRIKVVVEDDGAGSTINSFATQSGTLQGHPGAAGALAVGAAFFVNTPSCGFTPTLELFSSAGGDPILFDSTGTRLTTPVTRQKPDLIGPDGGNDTFLGFTLASGDITDSSTIPECANNANYPNFFGTSAAAPHVASIAALFLQADATLTPAQLYSYLRLSGVSIGAAPTACTPNFAAGYGFVQADRAAQMVDAGVPSAPTLTLGSCSIVTGSSTTITWSSANATGCTASGAWTGALASTGTQTVTPTAVGTDTYTIMCSNSAGNSHATSNTLTVTGPPPGAPTLGLASSTIVSGASTTISWSSSNASSCAASGSWSGTLATSGSQTVSPTAAGTDTYTLVCSNGAGPSPPTSVTLTVTPLVGNGNATAPSSGGGGTMELATLLGLLALCAARARHLLRSRLS